jgi:abortive infection bacteriophage resistance protein
LDQALFHDPIKHAKCLASLKEEIDRSHEVFIQHYLRKYTDPPLPPLWAACEVMSLGSLSKWFENLAARADRKRIADAYDLDEGTLASFLHHLTTLRNVCAHQARLWNRRFTVTMKIPRTRPVAAVRAFHQGKDAERRIYNSLTLLAHLANVITPGNDWLVRVRALVETAPTVDPTAMGFPPDWKRRPLWRDAR